MAAAVKHREELIAENQGLVRSLALKIHKGLPSENGSRADEESWLLAFLRRIAPAPTQAPSSWRCAATRRRSKCRSCATPPASLAAPARAPLALLLFTLRQQHTPASPHAERTLHAQRDRAPLLAGWA